MRHGDASEGRDEGASKYAAGNRIYYQMAAYRTISAYATYTSNSEIGLAARSEISEVGDLRCVFLVAL